MLMISNKCICPTLFNMLIMYLLIDRQQGYWSQMIAYVTLMIRANIRRQKYRSSRLYDYYYKDNFEAS